MINLRDGQVLESDFATNDLAKGAIAEGMRATKLATADFDGDGMDDIVSGFATLNGGILAIQNGNEDYLFANRPAAVRHRLDGTFTDSPFLARTSVLAINESPDFLAAGDFDGDGMQDILVASAGATHLTLLRGRGNGSFDEPVIHGIGGSLTSLFVGEIGQPDGLADVVAGIAAPVGGQLNVFANAGGAFNGPFGSLPLPASPVAITRGQLDSDFPFDLAVAAGSELVIVHGPTASGGPLFDTTVARTTIVPFSSPLGSIAAGDFLGDNSPTVAVLSTTGELSIVREGKAKATGNRSQNFTASVVVKGEWGPDTQLVCANTSSSPLDDIVILDGANRKIHILTASAESAVPGEPIQAGPIQFAATLDATTEPVALLPMRLNVDALQDLVVLKDGDSSPTVIVTQPRATFVVTNTNTSGAGSLRDAIEQANADSVADMITFNIPGAGPHTINVGTGMNSLPDLLEPVTIDGTTDPDYAGSPIIELNGSGASGGANGLEFRGGNSVGRGLVINRFAQRGMRLTNNDFVTIENCYLGTDVSGTMDLGNGNDGIDVVSSGNHTLGGPMASARNLVSGNGGPGVSFGGRGDHLVQGNLIGTDITGTQPLGNSGVGVVFNGATNRALGTGVPGGENIISSNGSHGITVGGSGNIIQANFIGLDITGTMPLGNTGHGILLNGGNMTLIGGPMPSQANIIAFNQMDGVAATDGQQNRIQRNSIYSNTGLGIDLNDDGPTLNDDMDPDTGPNALQNFPVLTSVLPALSGSIGIQGTLNSTPSQTFTIEFFSNDNCDPSGFGEGQTFLGDTMVMTDANGDAAFSVSFPGTLGMGAVITSTATASNGNTSEFSECRGEGEEQTDLSITKSDAPDPVITGQNITYTITISNDGDASAANVALSDTVPAGTTFVSFTAPMGWTSMTPAVGGTGTVTSTIDELDTGESAMFTLVVNVNCDTMDGAMLTNTATVASTTPDTMPMNNSAMAVTTASNPPPMLTCPTDPIVVPATGVDGCSFVAIVNFDGLVTVSDNCPGTVLTFDPPSGSSFPDGDTQVTVTATDSGGNTATCMFTVRVTGGFGICCVDDTTGDTFSQVVDSTSPLYGLWRYRFAATGLTVCGMANSISFVPGRSLVSYDNDYSAENPNYFMYVNLSFNTGTCLVQLRDRRDSPPFTTVLRDRNIFNNPPCR